MQMLKKERASTTILVLIVMIFLCSIIILVYMNINNKKVNQEKKINEIHEEYGSNNDIEQIYEETLQEQEGKKNR